MFVADMPAYRCLVTQCQSRIYQGSHASWKVLDFFPKILRNWKVLENEFGPGKYWNLPVVQLNQHVFYV